jgi:hypothetical protein
VKRLPSIWESARRPYTTLLITLLAAFCAYPLLGPFPWGRMAVSLVLLSVMASALFAIWKHHSIFWIGLILGGGTLVAMVLTFVFDLPDARLVLVGLEFIFLGLLAISIFLDVMRAERVTMDTVFGACCVYLMLGLTWTGIYEMIEILQPGSFDFGPLAGPSENLAEVATTSKLSYFSFITMTTVGYGDVTPVAPAAQAFAALQGLVGQLYMAIVIARFVAMELSERMRRGS